MANKVYTLTRVPVAVYPIFAIIGTAVLGASWYLQRLARQPDVVWNRRNPFPNLDVPQGHTIKMHDPTNSFAGKFYKREKL